MNIVLEVEQPVITTKLRLEAFCNCASIKCTIEPEVSRNDNSAFFIRGIYPTDAAEIVAYCFKHFTIVQVTALEPLG